MFNLVAADSEDEDEGGEDQEDESALDTDFGTLRHEVGSKEISTLQTLSPNNNITFEKIFFAF